MYKIKFVVFLFLFLIVSCNSYEEVSFIGNELEINLDNKIVFYNVENLFDTLNTPLKSDGEFTPDGSKQWNTEKYSTKINHISKSIVGIGAGKMPNIVGLCEIETYEVLKDLCYQSPLEKFGYSIIHKECEDWRGIDVALLYLPNEVEIIDTVFIQVDLGGKSKTRDILYVKINIIESNTLLNVFVNHWPSRYMGQNKSEYKRVLAAKTLKKHTDSLNNLRENVLIMGDFNDYYYNSSIKDYLEAKPFDDSSNLVNLMGDLSKEDGSYFYQGKWGGLDQFIVSRGFLEVKSFKIDSVCYYKRNWLLKDDKPARTYSGNYYLGGYSDHLPIVMYYQNNIK